MLSSCTTTIISWVNLFAVPTSIFNCFFPPHALNSSFKATDVEYGTSGGHGGYAGYVATRTALLQLLNAADQRPHFLPIMLTRDICPQSLAAI